MTDEDEGSGDPALLAGLERLVAVERVVALLPEVPWFVHLGQPLLADEAGQARGYLEALGFGGVAVAPVADWDAAAVCAVSPGFDSEWWDAEEQARSALTAQALETVDESEFQLALTRVAERAAHLVAPAADEAAGLAGVHDEDLVRAAAGAAIQACHQFALVAAAGAGRDHPFQWKFALFEAGRWPIAVTGETFHLF